jgi:transcriptional regulator with XRE-family HTH domain
VVARLLRALSGKSQDQLAADSGLHPSLVASFETAKAVPRQDHLEKLAQGAGITLEEISELVELFQTYRNARRRLSDREAETALTRLCEQLLEHVRAVHQQLRLLPVPPPPPSPEDREEAEELWNEIAKLSPEGQRAAVRLGRDFQTWALCERICHESEREAAGGRGERALELAQLAREIADRVGGPEEWRSRLRGYAAAYLANALRIARDPEAADAALEEAKKWWRAGSDPEGLLEEGWVM